MMSLLQAFNDWIVELMDPVLGWTLSLGMDWALVIVAVLTGVVMLVMRRLTSDQASLKMLDDDKKRIKQLIRQAKKAREKEAVTRYRATISQISFRAFRYEGKPLLVMLLPLVLLATWAFGRLGYIPPQPGEPAAVRVYLPLMNVGEPVHIVPVDGVEAQTGWIQRVRTSDDGQNGEADWTLVAAQPSDKPHQLTIRTNDNEPTTATAEFLVDGRRYASPLVTFDQGQIHAVELVMPEFKLFGVVPGLPFLQPWLVAYLLIAIPLGLGLKKILGIY